MSTVAESTPATGPSKEARAGAVMGLATLAMAGASAIQAVLYLSSFGLTARTDAFFAAFSLYTVFGVFTPEHPHHRGAAAGGPRAVHGTARLRGHARW